jgi:hypothetical protein
MPEVKKIEPKFKLVLIINAILFCILLVCALYLSDKTELNKHQEVLFSNITHLLSMAFGAFIGLLGGKAL